MPDSDLLSIVVISKDDPAGLRRTLDSIALQTFRGFETVVVAKGMSLGIDPAEFALPQLRWHSQESSGISAAFNEGLGFASGLWVNFLNGGDSYRDRHVLDRMRPLLTSTACLVAARAACPSLGIRIPRHRSFAARDVELVAHQATFLRRELFLRHGLYSPKYRVRMDFEWMLRLPADIETEWVDDDIVEFEAGGVSNTSPLQNCLEELHALRAHRRGAACIARLLALYLPLRMARHAWRRLSSGIAGMREHG